MKHISIAIVDDGLSKNLIDSYISFSEILQNDNNSFAGKNSVKEPEFSHGSICARVLEKNCPNVQFGSIRILDNKGKGLVKWLSVALEICLDKGFRIINLSLGTCHYKDKKEIRSVINHYVYKGMIIIAAASNEGFITYPASFSNVLSVAEGAKIATDIDAQRQRGIDFIAPSDHEITMEGVSFRLGKSNSYAAPYITALVGNLISTKGSMTVDEIRDHLCEGKNSFIYSPDWIESAWITPDYKRSKADYYFAEDMRSLQECIDDIDTIVLSNPEDVDKYADIGKHIVYIGEGNICLFDKKHHFWSRGFRREQIMSSKKKSGVLDIPTIHCIFDNQVDVIWCIYELKSLFANDGYNAFTGCSLVDSVLYDLEYLPDEDEIREKIMDFVYWQTYYQQSDLVLIGTVEKGFFINEPDMMVSFNCDNDGIAIRMICDDGEYENQYADLEIESITKIYDVMVSRFKKEDE